jgi:subtilisin family serine protease
LAGIAAGVPVSATWPGGSGSISGVAPRAQLMNYRVFYPAASGGGERAYTAEILQAIDKAVLDGADVILAAWSSMAPRLPLATPEAKALEVVMDAGIVVVTAAGNGGPAYGSASRLPGGLERIITVGAQGQPYGRALFGAAIDSPLGPFVLQDVSTACAPLSAHNSLAGSVATNGSPQAALIARGGCPFADKAYHVQQAGAALAIISNTQDQAIEMACTGAYCGAGVITIPAAMVTSGLGDSLRAWLASSPPDAPTIALDPVGRVASFHPQWVAPTSARGPAFAATLKPDVVAPGQAVVSSFHDGQDLARQFAALSGSSVAAAHVAGAAALLLQRNPGWEHDQVRAALMASARLDEPGASFPASATVLDLGAGMIDLARLAEASVVFDPPSLSLAHVAPGSTHEIEIAVRDLRASGDLRVMNVAVASSAQLHWTAPVTVTLSPGAEVTLTLQVSLPVTATPGDEQAYVILADAEDDAHLPVWAHVEALPQPATVLLLDNDSSGFFPNPDYAPFVMAALDEAAIAYAVWDADVRFGQPQTVPDATVLSQYDVVLWLTGDNIHPDGTYQVSTPLTAIDQQVLATYLDQGGRLLALGQNLAQASDINPDNNPSWGRAGLYHYYLGAHWLQGAVFGPGAYPPNQIASVQAVPASFLDGVRLDLGNVGDGDSNQSSIDEIAPGGLPDGSDRDLVQPLLYAVGASALGSGYVAVAKSAEPSLERPLGDLAYRTLYYAFGLEGINNNTGYTTRAELLARSIDWLRDQVTVTLAATAVGGAHRLVTLSCEAGSSVGADIREYRWRIGSGDSARVFTSAAPNVQVQFEERGTYPVLVETTDTLGHRAVAQGQVRIVAGGASRLDAQPPQVRSGQLITYTVRAINTDPVAITVAFTLPLPIGVTYLAHTGADYAAGALSWQGSLSSGQEVIATLTVVAPSASGGRVDLVATAEFVTDEERFTRTVITPVSDRHVIVMPVVMKGWVSP